MIKIYLDNGSSCFSDKESFEDFFKVEGPFLKYGFYEIYKNTMINVYHITKVVNETLF